MATTTTDASSSQATSKPKVKRKGLSFFLLIALVIAFAGYFIYNNSANSFINHNFYRVLYESSDQLNVNLTKLTRMLENNVSTSSIRSQLPSYKEYNNASSIKGNKVEFSYELKGKDIIIKINDSIKHSKVSIYDVLPKVKEGFSQYILADKSGNVLSSNGGEKTISFVNLEHISKKISEQKTSFSFTNKKPEINTTPTSLPSYSSHVDMTLSYGKFRIFVFPFKLSTPLQNGYFQQNNVKDDIKTFESLYLIALLPKHKLSIAGTGHWNISLLIVMSASLLSTIAMLRLFLLPQNHSITRFFRYFVIGSSYIFFITITALFFAYIQNTSLQNAKDEKAKDYTKSIVSELKLDISKVFKGLDKYRSFYINLLYEAKKESNNSLLDSLNNNKNNKNTFNELKISSIAMINNVTSLPISSPNNNVYCKALLAKPSKYIPQKIKETSLIDCIHNHLFLVNNDDRANKNTLSFYSKYLHVKSNQKDKKKSAKESLENDEYEIETYLNTSDKNQHYLPNNILNTLVVNKLANSALPSIYYRENNAITSTINISHRNYYKKVRDNKAYNLALDTTSDKFDNVYIQRLRNISNGSRGTTISMPLYSSKSMQIYKKNQNHQLDKSIEDESKSDGIEDESKSYVLAADVLLPSIDFAKPLKDNDFTYMVVDRNTGKVLFHSDESRSMVENLFYSGDNQSSLTQWIKAGLDINLNDKPAEHLTTQPKKEVSNEIKVLSGHYHGQPGRFFIESTIIPTWSVVVFYPKDSLDALMTSQFIYVFISALALMCLFIIVYFLPRWCCQHISICDAKRLFPKAYNRSLFLILSVVIYLGFGYHLISMMSAKSLDGVANNFSQLLYGINFILITLLLTFVYYKLSMNKAICWNSPVHFSTIKGIKKFGYFNRFFLLIFIILLIQLYFLVVTANMPIKGLLAHYHKSYCQKMNLESQELTQKALTLFPNSITQHSIKANEIMKPYLQNDQAAITSLKNNTCDESYSEITPGDHPNLSTLLGTKNLWQWIVTYFSKDGNNIDNNTKIEFKLYTREKLASYAFFILFILGWIEFNRQVLWRRLYCPIKLLQHIKNLTDAVKDIAPDSHSNGLEINCKGIKLNGVDLTYLLNTLQIPQATDVSHLSKSSSDSVSHTNNEIHQYFMQLFSVSTFLQTFNSKNIALPNLKIDIKQSTDVNNAVKTGPLLDVNIWDIEVCLDEPEHRQQLLALIMEFKSLVLSQQINSFTIYAGFHSLQRVERKNLLAIEYSSLLEHAEYLSWAECLMDFKMCVPKSFTTSVNKKTLAEELIYFPELSYLLSDIESAPNNKKDENKELFFGDTLIPRSIAEWSTLKYILLHAEPLYRFKWELCTSAEKLALFNLAKHRRINPENTKMIEHLALNGLIKVKDDHLTLVNKSFAQFVLYAETSETIAELERSGEHGVWKSYRIPIALLILLIIGGVAMTSGQSIYIITASLIGIITTIASVTNSANLLKNQFK